MTGAWRCFIIMSRALFLLLFSSLIAPLHGKETAGLQQDLLKVYQTWRQTMIRKDYKSWKQVTAYARQIETRNLVVSQKKRFPSAMFALPMKPPAIERLRLLQVNEKGPTAVAIFYGKADLDVKAAAPNSLLVLRYLKEGNQWKFYRLALMSQLPPEVIADVSANTLGFLKDAVFQPSGRSPNVQKPCEIPDYIADIHLITYGFDTSVTVNGISTHEASDTHGTQLVIGGLRNGKNTIEVEGKRLRGSAKGKKSLKVSVHLKTGNRKSPAVQVFEFKPDPAKGPYTYTGEFVVDKTTIGRHFRR